MNFQNQIDDITNQVLIAIEKAPLMKRTNEDRLNASGNIYFLYSNGELKYIGQRQAKSIKTRLDQHLFGKSYSVDENNVQNGTVSKWNMVKMELENSNEITFRAVKVELDNLRTTIELELISRLQPEWNRQGK